MKKNLILILALVGILALSACSTDKPSGDPDDNNEPELLQLTIEDLAMYDGQDGNDAYIAVNGVVYDVTDVPAWNSGTHNGGMVGMDVSDLINGSPHGESVLDDLTVVGELIE